MFRIVHTRVLGRGIKLFEIEAARVARKQRPGQFVIVRLHEFGERIPLTIAGSNATAGTITVVVQAVGKTTHLMNMLEAGDVILDLVGPLGKASEVKHYGTAVVVGGSVGIAVAWPTARALKQAGNRVISIAGSRSHDLVILENEMRAASDHLYVTTDDGSYGTKGVVTDKLRTLVDKETVDYVLAVGPVLMMQAVAELTHAKQIRTIVSLNSIMVDGTGMCGGCRVLVDGGSEFACVHGPEFDAKRIDFEVLLQRNNMYQRKERASLDEFLSNPQRDLDLIRRNRQSPSLELLPELEEEACG